MGTCAIMGWKRRKNRKPFPWMAVMLKVSLHIMHYTRGSNTAAPVHDTVQWPPPEGDPSLRCSQSPVVPMDVSIAPTGTEWLLCIAAFAVHCLACLPPSHLEASHTTRNMHVPAALQVNGCPAAVGLTCMLHNPLVLDVHELQLLR